MGGNPPDFIFIGNGPLRHDIVSASQCRQTRGSKQQRNVSAFLWPADRRRGLDRLLTFFAT